MSTSAEPIEIETRIQQLRRRGQSVGGRAVGGIIAGAALVTMIAFWTGKLNPSQMMLFMVSIPSQAPKAPVVSAKEILTGMQPVGNRIGEPVMEAQTDKQIRNALSMYDRCDSYCCRRDMLARAVGAAAITLGAPALAAETKQVKMGSDSGGLMFVPNEVTICKGDSVEWVGNKGMPHNAVFDEDGVPEGVDVDKLSKEEYINKPGDSYKSTFEVAGDYKYYCQPHNGAGMKGIISVMA